jgi:hypothetical protein
MVISKVSSSVLTHILVVTFISRIKDLIFQIFLSARNVLNFISKFKKNVNKNKFELLNKLAFDQLFLENV